MGSAISAEGGDSVRATTPPYNESLSSSPPSIGGDLTAEQVKGSDTFLLDNQTSTQTQHAVYNSEPTATTESSEVSTNSYLFNSTTLSSNHTSSNITITSSSDDFRFNLFGTDVYPFRWLTLTNLYSWLGPISSMAMIVGCVMPYVPQYTTIHKNRNSSGFSTFVCLTLLLANLLRIAFWFGHRFELPLLIQSIVMIVAQIFLLELCVRVKPQKMGSARKRRFLTSSLRYFWNWTDLASYLEFLLLISALLGIAMYFLISCEPFVETIGYCALVTESMLGLPQVIKNYKNKSVEGMSLGMVFMWLGGDTFKTGYFIANNVPFQFWLCGLLQITIDLLILFQVCLFRQNAPVKTSSRAHYTPKGMEL